MQLALDVSRQEQLSAQRDSDRVMWITPDRLFYSGLLGAPSTRTMGSVMAYVAVEDSLHISIDGGKWQVCEVAVVPPYVPHRILSEARLINLLKIEAETVDLAALPEPLRGCGAVVAPRFVERMRHCQRELCDLGRDLDLMPPDFDLLFFEAPLVARRIDRRIQGAIDRIKHDPSTSASAEECAQAAHLSFSRFLHLFRQEVGVPFRSFRTWKRARGLLHYVNRASNLARVALDTGYPDSTHFSHSIRQVYGLTPKEIFAGSRRLAVYAHASKSSDRTRAEDSSHS
ncbi:helix-turn-helix domain-containing protein [Paraburkholderia sediminicola]|uniref:helix-turn-helix domain-containing protein n=1 Tax=Paraburkholderia sediminicola TaxID=458836 RepID=UPI0038BD3ACE